jgi:hypothetical protein
VNALAKENVGKYVNTHFVSAFQKVAKFQVAGQQKNGGNVASYFCTPEGNVLHAIAGPVDEDTFLREIRWVNETYNMALLDNNKTLVQQRNFFRKAHHDRLAEHGHGIGKGELRGPPNLSITPQYLSQMLEHYQRRHGLGTQDKVHVLLTLAPLVKIEQLYQTVFERILNEKISTKPVQVVGK